MSTANGDSLWARLSERWALLLLALPFAGVGLGFLIMSVIPTVDSANQMQSWVEVQATLTSGGVETNRGDDSVTYEAYATYNYLFNGQKYNGDRVAINSGADNIGNFQYALGRRLERAFNEGRTLPVYVNPDNPQEAVLNRDLRWGLMVFNMGFALVFGGLGLAMLAYVFLARSEGAKTPIPLDDKPWLTHKDWARPVINSNSKLTLYVAWGFAVFWNLIAIPAGIGAVKEVSANNLLPLLGLLFPLVGLFLLGWAIKETRAWRRFGAAPLTMDPYPGAIGGQVGGSIEVRLPYDPAIQCAVTLACLQVYYTGSGKNRNRHEKVVWQNEGYARSQPCGQNGSHTRFDILFNVPDGLPQSEEAGNNYHLWRLSVETDLQGADFDRQYDLPVFPTGKNAQVLSDLSADHEEFSAQSEAAIEQVLDICQIPGGIELDFPAFRHPGGKLVGAVVGLVFTGAGYFIAREQASVGLFYLFPLLGVPLTLFCLYNLLVRLRVRLDHAELETRKTLLGFPAGGVRVPRSEITALTLKESYSQTQGSQHTTFFSLQAVRRTGKPITIGRNLAGQQVAQQALESIAALTGVPTQ